MEIQLGTTALEILKWVGIVFAAGLIGYFGRYLGQLLIERIHKKEPEPTRTAEVIKEIPADKGAVSEEDKLKAEKKQLKLDKKRAKKAIKPSSEE